jgi:catechol 2,3-dioxygenase-like lactoylglutathione lyase family enzyme
MLTAPQVSTRLPAKDLERAREFYPEKLGLEPVEERPKGLRYQCPSPETLVLRCTHVHTRHRR